ncbi:MAG TPA: aminoacyl-histidine dipeptidase [bacterium]|nr:aminoacyl-histidine dipeptidase [bacterium]
MDEKTKRVLAVFEEINKVPRRSKQEEKIVRWLVDWAKKRDLAVKTDKVSNVLITVPASKGCEKAPTLVVQGHMDMVCEKTPDSPHDFTKDPIKCIIEGDWMHADKTTLGADNGIAIALALAIAEDPEAAHPKLELLFTVDEETGLTGANAIEPGFLTGKVLLNVDSEDEGIFTVGCAGGRDTKSVLPLTYEKAPAGSAFVRIYVGGLLGGHSGVDIKEHRGNANIILARLLAELRGKMPFALVTIKGGSAHNAIPRDAEAVIAVPEKSFEQVGGTVAAFEKVLKNEFPKDNGLKLTALRDAAAPEAMDKKTTDAVIDLILALPHGIAAMSAEMEGLVETSNNLAILAVADKKLTITTSQRSSVMSRLDWLTLKVETIARRGGATPHTGGGYPSWQPNIKSPLLARCLKVYKELFKVDAKVEAIHAGLECGIIGAKYDGMDMISFGPTVKNPHSPDEKMFVPSVGRYYDFMKALFKSYC